jgi:DNA-binding beta-propeller fold protein YncE
LRRKETAFIVAQVLIVVAVLVLLALPLQSLNQRSTSLAQTTATTASYSTPTSASPANGTAPSISSVLVANVTVSGFPGEIAVNPNTNRIYISDEFSNILTVVDASSHSVIGTVALPGTAANGAGIAVDTTSDNVYVPVWGCTNVQDVNNSCISGPGTAQQAGIVAIDGATDNITGEYRFDVGGLAVNPSTGILYGISVNAGLSSNSTGFLLEISEDSGSLIANISLGAGPLDVGVNAKTNMVYVTACKQLSLSCTGAELLVINGTSHSLQSVTPFSLNALNFSLAIDPSTNTVYTMGEEQNLTLVAVDGASGKVVYSQAIGSSCAGSGGGVLALDIASGLIYASFDSQSFFLVINASTGRTVNMLSTPGWLQYAAFNPAASQVYATSEAQSQKVGYLLTVPGALNESYVNINLLQLGTCVP